MTNASVPELPTATKVVIIGGGIAGVATAYFLAKEGIATVVCEKGRVAGEQSSRNWGWVRKQGRDPREIPAAKLSLDIWAGLETDLGSDLGWTRGGISYLAANDKEMQGFERWLEDVQPHQLDSRLLSARETDALLKTDGSKWAGALYTASDGRAEPGKAVPALATGARRLGTVILEGCAVRGIETEAGRISGVVTEKGEIACEAVVCAGGVWSSLFCRSLDITLPQLKVRATACRTTPGPRPFESAVDAGPVAIRPRQDGGFTVAPGTAVAFDIVPDALRFFRDFLPALRGQSGKLRLRLGRPFMEELMRPKRWRPDEVTPFERVRVLDPEPDRAFAEAAFAAAKAQFPHLQGTEIAETWAGAIESTPDAIPVLSEVESLPGFYIATGFSGHGFGFGPAAGRLMADLVSGVTPRVDIAPFHFSRFANGSDLTPYDFT